MAIENKDIINFRKTFIETVRDAFLTRSDSFYPDLTSSDSVKDIIDTIESYGYRTDNERSSYEVQDRVLEYEAMMKALPELDAIFTFYSDEATMENFLNNKIIWAENKLEDIKIESNKLLEFLEIGYNLPLITYNLVAYGNAYAELIIREKGVSRIVVHDVKTIKRMELPDGRLLGFAKVNNVTSHINISVFRDAIKYKDEYLIKYGKIKKSDIVAKFGFYPFEHFEVIHWRLRKYSATEMYGYSVMDALRGHWKNNVMARASLLLNRIMSASSRRKITIEVGNTTNTKDIKKKLREFGRMFKRKEFFNENGLLKNIFDPHSEMEDLHVPMINGVPMYDFEELTGKDISSKTEDVEYIDKFVQTVSLIPKSLLDGEGESRSTLAQENIRFAKRIYNVQQEITKGVKKIVIIHLHLNGYTAGDILDNPVIIKMNFASDTAKLIQVETMNQLIGYFQSMENIYPDEERYFRALGISKKEFERYRKEIEKDKIREALVDTKVEAEIAKYKKKNGLGDE